MSKKDFHKRPFDEDTLAKLQVFELYVEAWLPVFLAKKNAYHQELHIFDFFCGPGTDSEGNPGSPLRILKKLHECQQLDGWHNVKKIVHLFDADSEKINELRQCLEQRQTTLPEIQIISEAISFKDTFQTNQSIFEDPKKAKLLFIDQFGVNAVTDEIFKQLIAFSTTDFIMFLATSTLNRFREHPAIKIKIKKTDDSYKIHRAACEYFRELASNAYIGQFSIKKKSNIYGLIFGSRHPLGMQKFLEVAWKNDAVRGEANFDVDRENLDAGQTTFTFGQPKKIELFEKELSDALSNGKLTTEEQLLRFCFRHGMIGKHAKPVIKKLKEEKIVQCSFFSPDARKLKEGRIIQVLQSRKETA